MELKRDIEQREDLTVLLTTFYARASEDTYLAQKFADIDMPSHIPVIVDFWEAILLGGKNYSGNPFNKHVVLDLKKEHFERWVHLFKDTIDSLHSGKRAEDAKFRANTIATLFQNKLGL